MLPRALAEAPDVGCPALAEPPCESLSLTVESLSLTVESLSLTVERSSLTVERLSLTVERLSLMIAVTKVVEWLHATLMKKSPWTTWTNDIYDAMRCIDHLPIG